MQIEIPLTNNLTRALNRDRGKLRAHRDVAEPPLALTKLFASFVSRVVAKRRE